MREFLFNKKNRYNGQKCALMCYNIRMAEESINFSVLSLSGGGFRGLFTARVLAELEREAGRMVGKEHRPIGECFDLICGTSIGGVLAMAIGLEKPMADIAQLMEKRGSKIFPRWLPRQFLPDCVATRLEERFRGFCSARHTGDALRQVVAEIFGDSTIGDSRHHLVIPAVNYSSGSPQFFKTGYSPTFRRDGRLRMGDVALATSAAPIFLPMHKFEETGARYVDGGLVGNNPALFGIHEAEKFMEQKADEIRLLSIGTMSSECRADASHSLNAGIWGWGTRLYSLTVSAQEKVVDSMVQHKLGDRYCCIDETPNAEQEKNIGLDIADQGAIDTLKSMADRAVQKFVGLPECGQFLGHTAKFKPTH